MFSFQKISRKLRRIERKNFGSKIKYKEALFAIFSLPIGEKISLIGGSIMFLSLFLIWGISPSEQLAPFNSFHRLVGGIGYIVIVLLFMYVVLWGLYFKKSNLIFYRFGFRGSFSKFGIVTSLLSLFLVIQSFVTLQGLKVFLQDIEHGNGIPLCITGLIIFLIGNIFICKKNSRGDSGKYYTNLKNQESQNRGFDQKNIEDNMKLPF